MKLIVPVGARTVACALRKPWTRPAARTSSHVRRAASTYPEAGLVRLMLEGGVRLQIRPSGTEPKVKLYAEAVDLDRSELDHLLSTVTSGVRPQM